MVEERRDPLKFLISLSMLLITQVEKFDTFCSQMHIINDPNFHRAAFTTSWAALRHWKHWILSCLCVNEHRD